MAAHLSTSVPLSAILASCSLKAQVTEKGNVIIKKTSGKNDWVIPGKFGTNAAIFDYFSSKIRRPVSNDILEIPTSSHADDAWQEFEQWYGIQHADPTVGHEFIPGTQRASTELVALPDYNGEDAEPQPLIDSNESQAWAVSFKDPGVYAVKRAYPKAKAVTYEGKTFLAYYHFPGAAEGFCPNLALIKMPAVTYAPLTTAKQEEVADKEYKPKAPKPRAPAYAVEREKRKPAAENSGKRERREKDETRWKKTSVKKEEKHRQEKGKPAPARALLDKGAQYIYSEATKIRNEKLVRMAKMMDKRADGDERAAMALRALLLTNEGPLGDMIKQREVSICKAALLSLKKFVKEFTYKGEPRPVPFAAYVRKCMVLAGYNFYNFCFLLQQCGCTFVLQGDFSVSERRTAASFLVDDDSEDDDHEREDDSSPSEDERDGYGLFDHEEQEPEEENSTDDEFKECEY